MSFYRLFNRTYRDYVRSEDLLNQLNLIVVAAAVGTFLFTVTGGVAFTGYASTLGAGEFAFGVITALPVLAGLMQIYVSHLLVKHEKYKSFFIVGGLIQRTSWVIIAFIPYFIPLEQSRLFALIVLVTLAAMAGSFVAISHATLMGSVIPIEIRGRFVTTRQKVCTAFSLIFGLCVAFFLDNTSGFLGYTIVFALGGVAGLIDILMYGKIKFNSIPNKPEGFSLIKGIKDCFTTPVLRNYLLFWTAWFFAIHISGPFFNKYAIDVLNLSYISIILFGQIAAQTMAFLVISKWGVFLDRYGSVPVMMISTVTSTILGFVWMFAIPGSIWPMFVFNFIGGMVWCANDACMVNMQMSHTPSKGRPAALAVYAVFTSIAAALALILGGGLLEFFSPIMKNLDWTFVGAPFDHYKVVFIISSIFRAVVVIFFLPKVWNEKEMTVKEAYGKAFENFKIKIAYESSRFKLRRK